MMKQKQLPINSVKNTNDESRVLKKLDGIISDSMPKGILGMLLTATESADGKEMIFANRYHLITVEKNYYDIYDSRSDAIIFPHVALLANAVNIIYNVNKTQYNSAKEFMIYALDQQYYRCVEDIKHYKHKIKIADCDRAIMFSARLTNSQFRLDELKMQLSKIF